MGKALNKSGAGVVRTLLKYKDDFHCELRDETKEGNLTRYVFDVFYETSTGTFTIVTDGTTIHVAALNLSMGKVINLTNDQNLRKLAEYVLKNFQN